jgi:RecA/RadA recombinase
MSSLMSKMLKTGAIKESAVLSKSKFFGDLGLIKLPVPMMNVYFSGSLDGGIGPGLHMLAGPSKHFKSNMGLVTVKAFQDAEPEGIVIFYDSEFGSTEGYFKNFGIDTSRILHIPIMNVEELKFDIVQKLEAVEKGDKIFIFIDSVGNLASKKEVEDAKNEKSVADMTRAKQLKSLWRMVTPYLTVKRITCVCINHTYETIEMFSKPVMSGGTGGTYSSNSIAIIGKRQIKDGAELMGWEFVLNAEKSRYIKEKSSIPITVLYDGGIDKYSGLLEVAEAVGFVEKPKQGWFTRPTVEGDKNWRRKDTNTEEFWTPLLGDQRFKDKVQQMFSLGSKVKPIEEGDFDPETGEVFEEEDDFNLLAEDN